MRLIFLLLTLAILLAGCKKGANEPTEVVDLTDVVKAEVPEKPVDAVTGVAKDLVPTDQAPAEVAAPKDVQPQKVVADVASPPVDIAPEVKAADVMTLKDKVSE